MAAGDTPGFPWTGIAPADWVRAWQAVWRAAPDNLSQPILPGWTFNINSSNSTAPHNEVDLVAQHSYGRQIGRPLDALELRSEERYAKAPVNKRFSDFLTMRREIDNVKQDTAATRVERIVKDLAPLKAQDQEQYMRLRGASQEALR
jgi:hypothetical protein